MPSTNKLVRNPEISVIQGVRNNMEDKWSEQSFFFLIEWSYASNYHNNKKYDIYSIAIMRKLILR